MSDYSVKIGIKADTGIMQQALVSFKKYMPPPLPYFNVNICPLPLPHFGSQIFSLICDPFADSIISLHSLKNQLSVIWS
jgi:hypothetical protein